MRYLPPIRWADVMPGMVVMDSNGIARTVLANDPYPPDRRLVLAEGVQPWHPWADEPAYLVELDATEAIGTLHAAGLNPTPIEGTS